MLDREIHLPARQASGLLWLLAQSLELEYRREFFGYDVIFYAGQIQKDRWTAPANIAAVLEHENDANTSHHEVYKLSLSAIPLKVLIAYPDDFGHAGELLESYLRILSGSPVDLTGEFIVIFGVPGRRSRAANWIPYVYNLQDATFDFVEEIS